MHKNKIQEICSKKHLIKYVEYNGTDKEPFIDIELWDKNTPLGRNIKSYSELRILMDLNGLKIGKFFMRQDMDGIDYMTGEKFKSKRFWWKVENM